MKAHTTRAGARPLSLSETRLSLTVLRFIKSPSPFGLKAFKVQKQVPNHACFIRYEPSSSLLPQIHNFRQRVLYIHTTRASTKTAPVRLATHGPLGLLVAESE